MQVLMSHLAMSESGIIALEQDIMSHKSKKSRKVAFKDKIKAAKDAHMNNKLASNNPSSNANNPIDSLDMNIANAIYQATKIQNISLPGGHPACTHKQKSNVDVDVSSLFAD